MPKGVGQASPNNDEGELSLRAQLHLLVSEGIASGFEPHTCMEEIKAKGRQRLAKRAL